MATPPLPPLLWMAPALSGGGYASESIAFGLGLSGRLGKRGADGERLFALRQFAEQPDPGFIEGLPAEMTGRLGEIYESPRDDRWPLAGVVVCHATPDAWVPSKFAGWDALSPCPPRGGAFAVGRTMYETDRLPGEWVERCNAMDEVWVPTAFHRDSFAAAGVAASKLVVVGEPVDTAFFDPQLDRVPFVLPPRLFATRPRRGTPTVEALESSEPTRYRFLSVFKWEERKGWDVLLGAYFAEFGADEPVELVLKTKPFYSSGDFQGLIAGYAQKLKPSSPLPAVRLIGHELELKDLPRLYAAADSFVLPSRGEGWGRPHVEAMAMGLPVIATNWSGPTAYLDEGVGYPLEYTLVPVPPALELPGHRWAEPSVDHLRKLMRRVYTQQDEARARGAAARERMVRRFSPRALAADVAHELARIGAARPPMPLKAKQEL